MEKEKKIWSLWLDFKKTYQQEVENTSHFTNSKISVCQKFNVS